MKSDYPSSAAARTRWILARRGPRAPADPTRPAGVFTECEPDEASRLARVLTVLLTNRECPWRCVMCDLWRHTTEQAVPPGAIPAQLRRALARRPVRARPAHLKLYNAGSFFDPGAIPPADHAAIARLAAPFDRVIVECHPRLVGPAVAAFLVRLEEAAARPLAGGHRLEVAMGLETAHPGVLAQLNKRMTLDLFARAADFLRQHGVGLRAFVLVQPPFLPPGEAVEWAVRSAEKAFECGASVVTLIPTRAGNGAMEALATARHFTPPSLATLEASLAGCLRLGRGRVFADLWDLEKFPDAPASRLARVRRLRRMNRTQQV